MSQLNRVLTAAARQGNTEILREAIKQGRILIVRMRRVTPR
jgi:hypothetical protein